MTDKEIKNEIVEDAKVDTPIETDTKTMSENYETLKATVDAMTSDFEKFNSKKIKAAGQRARSNLLTIKKLCDTLRKQIIVDIKDIPIKHRIDTDEEIPEPVEPNDLHVNNSIVEQTVVPETPNVSEDEIIDNILELVKPDKKVRKPRRANKKKTDEKKEV